MSAAAWVKEQWPVLVAIAAVVGATLTTGSAFVSRAEAAGAKKADGLEQRIDKMEERMEQRFDRLERILMEAPHD